MKRFYTSAAARRQAESHDIALDGKVVRTPAGRPLLLPNRALAEAVAGEWQAQGDVIVPATMPLTAIANTAIDRVAVARDDAVAGLMRYGETDLLCYRAEGPADLVARQGIVWQALLDWASLDLGATLVVTEGVVPVPQPPEALAALRGVLHGYDDFRLAALSTAVAATGSLVLGLALAEGRLSAEEAFAAAQLDETYQNEFWGEDAEAMARRATLDTDVAAAATIFRLLAA